MPGVIADDGVIKPRIVGVTTNPPVESALIINLGKNKHSVSTMNLSQTKFSKNRKSFFIIFDFWPTYFSFFQKITANSILITLKTIGTKVFHPITLIKIQSMKFSLEQNMKINFFKSCSFRVPGWLRIITCGSRAEYNIWIRYTAYYLTWLNKVFCF